MTEKILGLNVIVGKGDVELLTRLLAACDAMISFDEVVIVDTFGGVPDQFKPIRHEWTSERYPKGNFAAARNKALDNTGSRWVMWLDCDDLPPLAAEIAELKQMLKRTDRDFYFMPYLINKSKDGKYTSVFNRERIFRNNGKIRWKHPVHEQLELSCARTYGEIKNSAIRHDTLKPAIEGITRNIDILQHEVDLGDTDPHTKFNYAKDLMLRNSFEYSADDEAVALVMMQDLIDNHELSQDNLAMISAMVAQALAYKVGVLSQENRFEAELYARICMSFGDKMAEPYVIVGDYMLSDKQIAIETAIDYYKTALEKKPSGTSVCQLAFYVELPAYRLSKIYQQIRQYENALVYNAMVLRSNPSHEDAKKDRQEILKCLNTSSL